jgi:hypothetical protein
MTRMRPILLALAIGLPGTHLTACLQLPTAVASEMQPATCASRQPLSKTATAGRNTAACSDRTVGCPH